MRLLLRFLAISPPIPFSSNEGNTVIYCGYHLLRTTTSSKVGGIGCTPATTAILTVFTMPVQQKR